MRGIGLHPTAAQLEMIVGAALASKLPEAAVSALVDAVRIDTVTPSSRAYTPIFRYLAAHDLPDLAVELLQLMGSTGQQPDAHTFGILEAMRRYDLVLEGVQLSPSINSGSTSSKTGYEAMSYT
jgi:hypothetical protein